MEAWHLRKTLWYSVVPVAASYFYEAQSPDNQKPRLVDRVRQEICRRNYSRRTENSYVAWSRRFILYHGKRHPAEMGEVEISRYLTDLAVDRKVSASTQNQALSALFFFTARCYAKT